MALLDPHCLLREAVASWLERYGPYHMAWMGGAVEELLAAVDAGRPPWLVLVALRADDDAGFGALERLRTERPALRCVAYAHQHTEAMVLRAYRTGAAALLHCTMGREALLSALVTAGHGGVHHTPDTQQVLLDNPDGLTTLKRNRQRLLAQLTDREAEVLELVVRNPHLTNAKLGCLVNVERRTLESHLEALYEVFGLHGRTALVVAAIQLGMVKV